MGVAYGGSRKAHPVDAAAASRAQERRLLYDAIERGTAKRSIDMSRAQSQGQGLSDMFKLRCEHAAQHLSML